jgi:hypothetical protein
MIDKILLHQMFWNFNSYTLSWFTKYLVMFIFDDWLLCFHDYGPWFVENCDFFYGFLKINEISLHQMIWNVNTISDPQITG